MADRQPPIRTPLGQQWRRIRYQLMPVLVFATVLLAAGWLWQRHAAFPNAVGEVAAVQIPVRSQYAGYLCEQPKGRFDRVEKGEMVARLEDKALESARAALEEDVKALLAEVEATRASLAQEQAERGFDRLREFRRLALDIERTELAIIDLDTTVAGEKAALERYSRLLEQAEELERSGDAYFQTVVDLTLQREESDAIIRGRTQEIAQARINLKAAHERLKAHNGDTGEVTLLDAHLEPIQRRRAAQAKRVQEIRLQLAAMTLRAPTSGTICAVLRHKGQSVQAGEDILLITPDHQTHIIAYVPEHRRLRPTKGMKVVVRSRTRRPQSGEAKVVQVGPQFEVIPPHQSRSKDLNRTEWGLPVMISIPANVQLRPGELVDIIFKST